MMRLKMQLEKVKEWWKPENATVSMLDLIKAQLLGKLLTGPIYILSLVEQAMSKIRLEAYVTQSQAKATIVRRTTEQTKPVQTIGYQAGTGFQYQFTSSIPNNTITFNQNNKPVLVITNDGDVEWHGKPSEAADALETVFQFKVEDMKGVTKSARRRYYYKACKNILNKAETMEYKEFLAYLNKQVYNREKRVIMDSLKGEDNAG